MFGFDKNIFKGPKKRNTSQRTENRTELFRSILSQEVIDLHELEELCFHGIPEDRRIKAMCWKILLGYLPLKTSEWKSHLQTQRNLYEFYINLLFQNPETYNNGQGMMNNNHLNKQNDNKINKKTSSTPTTDLQRSASVRDVHFGHGQQRPFSARPATNNYNNNFNIHSNAIHPKYHHNNAYFQDDNNNNNNNKKIKKIKKKLSFFDDSDDERGPKPGLFDSDDDDILNIITPKTKKKEKENKNEQDIDINSDAETPIPNEAKIYSLDTKIIENKQDMITTKKKGTSKQNEHENEDDKNNENEDVNEDKDKKHENTKSLSSNDNNINVHKRGHSNNTSGDEILFITPSTSKKSSSSFRENLDNPLLKDINPSDQDDPLQLLKKTSSSPTPTNNGNNNNNEEKQDKENKKEDKKISFDEAKTPKIFSDDTPTPSTTTSSTPINKPKHSKTDSKILINGKEINNENDNDKEMKSSNIKPLNFKPTSTPDPLAQTPNNPWKTYFDDWEIWNRIKKDIHRTHQTYAFFRSNHMICDNSASKSYRFPFDISSTPTPITPSMSAQNASFASAKPAFPFTAKSEQLPDDEEEDDDDNNNKDGNNKKRGKHQKTDSSPILGIPDKGITPLLKEDKSSMTYDDELDEMDENDDAQSSSATLSDDVDDTQYTNYDGDGDDNDENQNGSEPKENKKASIDEKKEDENDNNNNNKKEENKENKENKGNKGKRLSLLKIDAEDEIISDIESIDTDDGMDENGMIKPEMIDLPPPAAKNIKFKKRKSDSVSISISNSIDPNKKARIERYVMDSKQHGIHAQIMIRILCVYARLNKGVEYVQGMNELLAPIYYIFNMDPSDNARYAEADSFFCFMNLMSYLADRFIAESDNSQLGIIAVVNEFDELLERADYELWNLLKRQDLDPKFYALRWLMLLMAMEFQLPEVLRLWDSFLSDHNRFEFVTYFAIAMIHKVKPQLMAGNFATNLQLLQKYPSFDLYELLLPAMQFRDKLPLNIVKNTKKKKKNKRKKAKSMQQNTSTNIQRHSSLKSRHQLSVSNNNIMNMNMNKNNKNKSRSPRDIFRNGKNSTKDLLGNILHRPQSTRNTNNHRSNRPNPAYNIFRSRSPITSSSTTATLQRQQTFSFGQWKKKWSTK